MSAPLRAHLLQTLALVSALALTAVSLAFPPGAVLLGDARVLISGGYSFSITAGGNGHTEIGYFLGAFGTLNSSTFPATYHLFQLYTDSSDGNLAFAVTCAPGVGQGSLTSLAVSGIGTFSGSSASQFLNNSGQCSWQWTGATQMTGASTYSANALTTGW